MDVIDTTLFAWKRARVAALERRVFRRPPQLAPRLCRICDRDHCLRDALILESGGDRAIPTDSYGTL
jgi:hypothetical protein